MKNGSKRVGLFFGSFNPIHVGHLIIATHVLDNSDLSEIWFVVSPHNPLKNKASLANDYDRLNMVELAIKNTPGIKSSNIEFALPKPSYTIDTLTFLKEKYPKLDFCILMGGDNIQTIDKWKNYEVLVSNYPIYVYNRPGYDAPIPPYAVEHGKITVVDAPLMDISSTLIRDKIKAGHSIKYIVTDEVEKFIDDKLLYKK